MPISKRGRKKRNRAQKKLRNNSNNQGSIQQMNKSPKKVSPKDQNLDRQSANRLPRLLIAGILSIALGVYIGTFVNNQFGMIEGIKWGLIAGASIWVTFYGSFWLNRWLRRH